MENNKCQAGCKLYTGGEIKHHKDCLYYPESMSKTFDDMKSELKKLRVADVSRSDYNHIWQLMNKLNTIMRESYMIEGREFGKAEGHKIMGILEQWAERH